MIFCVCSEGPGAAPEGLRDSLWIWKWCCQWCRGNLSHLTYVIELYIWWYSFVCMMKFLTLLAFYLLLLILFHFKANKNMTVGLNYFMHHECCCISLWVKFVHWCIVLIWSKWYYICNNLQNTVLVVSNWCIICFILECLGDCALQLLLLNPRSLY